MRRSLCVVLSLILLIGGFVPVSAKETNARSIVVFLVEGDVIMTKGTAKEFKAKAGTKLSDGYTAATGDKSYCYIKLDEDSLAKMDEGSMIRISKTSSTKLSLSILSGSMSVDAAPQGEGEELEIRAGSSALSVRGTLFVAEYKEDGIYTIYMLEGSGEVNGVLLEAGYVIRMNGGSADGSGGSGQYEIEKIVIDENLSLFVLETVLENIDELLEKGLFTENERDFAAALATEKRAEMNANPTESTDANGNGINAGVLSSQSENIPVTTPGPDDQDDVIRPTGAPVYRISYNMNGVGVVTPEAQSANAGDTIIAARPAVVRPTIWPPVEFKEWNTSADGTGTPYMPGDKVMMPAGGLVLYAAWDMVPLYNVRYELNGGTGYVPSESGKEAGESFYMASVSGFIPPTGKAFKEWNTKPDGSGTGFAPGIAVSMPASDITFYATWEPIYYSVIYDLCSGSGIVPTEIKHAEGEIFAAAGTEDTVPPPGAVFKEWNTQESGAGTGYAEGEAVTMPAHDLNLYAVWDSVLISYTVTYDLCSGAGIIPMERSHTEGEMFAAAGVEGIVPPEDMQFKEWNTEPDGGGTGYAIGCIVTMPANDLVLYAVWESAKYYKTVIYNANGGTGTVPVEAYHAGGEIFFAAGISDIQPPFGMAFKEWNTMADGRGTAYAMGEAVIMPANGLILYAIWVDATVFSVTYNLNEGAEGDIPIGQVHAPGDEFQAADILGVDPTVGKEFKEWNTKADGSGITYGIGDTVIMPESDLVLYAIWVDAIVYDFTYDLNGGYGSATVGQTHAPGYEFQAAGILGVDPPVGKEFKEWNTKADGSGITYGIGDTVIMPESDLVLYAIWENVIVYDFTYDLNGGYGFATIGQTHAPGYEFQAADILGVDPPVGKEFQEWNTKADGSGITYGIGDTVIMPESDLVLYAIWENVIVYDFTYDLNGGYGSATVGQTHAAGYEFQAADILGVDPPVGKEFKEWNTKADGSGITYGIGDTVIMPESDLVLYAIWVDVIVYDFTYDLNGGYGSATVGQVHAPGYEFQAAGILGVDPPVGKEFKEWNTKADGSGITYGIGDTVIMPESDLVLYAIWVDVIVYDFTYDFTYDLNGGYGSAPAGQAHAAGYEFQAADILGVDPPVGKEFKEWNTKADGSGITYGIGDTVIMPESDLVLYAIWVDVIVYDFTYDLNGGYGSVPIGQAYAAGYGFQAAGILVLDPLGKEFKEWNTKADGSGITYGIGDTVIMPESDLVLYAIWVDVIVYDFTYDLNGGYGLATIGQTRAAGYEFQAADILGVDPPVGKKFKEWNTKADGSGITYGIGDTVIMPESDLVLYAIWVDVIVYDFTYDLNGGYGSATAGQTHAAGHEFQTAGILGVDPPVGKEFKEWNTKADGSGITYGIGDTVIMPESDLVLYAIWENVPVYTVTYVLTGSLATDTPPTPPTEVPHASGEVFAAAAVDGIAPPEGMIFKEWNTDVEGMGTRYEAGANVTMPPNDLTLYSIWTPITYSVRYNLNGGSGTVPEESAHIEGETFAAEDILGITPPDGMQFKEWNTDAAGVSGSGYTVRANVTVLNEDIVLYAIWENYLAEKTITYYLNDGSGVEPTQGLPVQSPVPTGGEFVVGNPSDIVPPTGMQFLGWYTTADGSGDRYAPFDVVTVPAYNLNLYASWGDMAEINNANTLKLIGSGSAYPLDGRYVLTNDIVVDFVIGSEDFPFNGEFDGGGNKIVFDIEAESGYIDTFSVSDNDPDINMFSIIDSYNIGLFASIGEDGIVKNLDVSGGITVIEGYFGCIGGIAGNNYGTIENCNSNVVIEGENYIGGITGTNRGIIDTCVFTGSISGYDYIGGMAGYNYGTIVQSEAQNCSIDGAYYVGGIAGVNDQIVQDCIVEGAVSGTSRVGGIAGTNYGMVECAEAKNSSINGKENIGGITGFNGMEAYRTNYEDGYSYTEIVSGSISNCFANDCEINIRIVSDIGETELEESDYWYGNVIAGGITGTNFSGTIAYCGITGLNLNINVDAENEGYYGTARVGGIVGESGHSTIQYCYVKDAAITLDFKSSTYNDYYLGALIGGIVGNNSYSSALNDCYTLSTTITCISLVLMSVGGIAGYTEADISNCMVIGTTVSGEIGNDTGSELYVGGIAGSVFEDAEIGPIVRNCIALGDYVSGSTDIIGTPPGSSPSNVYAGRIYGSPPDGDLPDGVGESNYALSTMLVNGTTADSELPKSQNGKNTSLESVQVRGFFVETLNWNFSDFIWIWDDVNARPRLAFETEATDGIR